MNRIFKKNEIQNIEPEEEEEEEEEGNDGDVVTSENLDTDIVKQFGAKIPALNGINLNDPVAKQTVAGMINGNSEYKKILQCCKSNQNYNSKTSRTRYSTTTNRGFCMKSVTITVDDSTVTIWQNLILEQKRLGEIDRKTTTNKRMFRAFVQEYIDLKLKKELLERLEITRKVKFHATS